MTSDTSKSPLSPDQQEWVNILAVWGYTEPQAPYCEAICRFSCLPIWQSYDNAFDCSSLLWGLLWNNCVSPDSSCGSGRSNCCTVCLFPPNIFQLASSDNDMSSKNNVSRCGCEVQSNPNMLFLPFTWTSDGLLQQEENARMTQTHGTHKHTHKYFASIFIYKHTHTWRQTHTQTHTSQIAGCGRIMIRSADFFF